MSTTDAASSKRLPRLHPGWKVEEFADPELLASSEGSRRVVERDQKRLRAKQAEIAAEKTRG